MKDLVALQMTRRQPLAAYDSGKAKSPAQANRQVRTRTRRPGRPCAFRFCCVAQTSREHMQAHVFLDGFRI